MDCFLYDLQLVSDAPVILHGFAKYNNKTVLLVIHGFKPWCYVDLPLNTVKDICRRHDIVYMTLHEVYMPTSLSIKNKKSLIKITFTNYLNMKQFARRTSYSNCYMHELECIPIFTSKYGLDFVGWVNVKDAYTKPDDNITTLDTYHVSHPNKISPIDGNEPTYPTVLAFDIECMVSSKSGMPKTYKPGDKLEMISLVMANYMSGKMDKYLLFIGNQRFDDDAYDDITQLFFSTEVELLRKFCSMINELDPDIITGYNIYGFDFKYIFDRLNFYLEPLPNMSRIINGQTNLVDVDWESSAYGYNTYCKVEMDGRIIVDLMLYFKRFKLEKYSLDFVSEKFLGVGKDDVPYEEIWNAFESRDPSKMSLVGKYCVKDSVLVVQLFEKFNLWTDLCEMSKAMRCRIGEIYTRGEQLKVKNQTIKECINRNIVLAQIKRTNSTWDKYSGANVLSPERGMYNQCCVLDFQSLYPSIMVAHNICPSVYVKNKLTTHDVNTIDMGTYEHKFLQSPIGILSGLVKNLMDKRKEVKLKIKKLDEKDIYTKLILDRRQNALKICANSVYGIMGFEKNKYFGHLGCAESITRMGRKYLDQIVNHISSKYPVRVIYGDTDSCMVIPTTTIPAPDYIQLCHKICEDVTSMLPQPMALNFEEYYDKIILMSKKRYIMYKHPNLKYKGVMNARRGYCQFAKNLYGSTITDMVNDVPKDQIISNVNKHLTDLLRKDVPINLLSMTKSVKNLDEYKVEPPQVLMAKRLIANGIEINAGTRLEYVFTTSGDKQGERMYMPDELTRIDGLEVDPLYYMEHQIMSQIDDLLGILGEDNYVKQMVKSMKKAERYVKKMERTQTV